LSQAPTEDDVKLAKQTADTLSSLIQMAFHVNLDIPPMPPYPAIPIKNLEKLISSSEALLHQSIMYAKMLKIHAMAKKLDIGPLVTALASIDISMVRIHFSEEKG